jgi:hypothetical protein
MYEQLRAMVADQARPYEGPELQTLQNAIPGYTGFVPRARNHFASRYADIKATSASEFAYSLEETRASLNSTRASVSAKFLPPARAHSAEPYESAHSRPEPVMPYTLPHGDPSTRFITGYTGHIPRTGDVIGATYHETMVAGLTEYEAEQRRLALTGRRLAAPPKQPRRYSTDPELRIPTEPPTPGYTGYFPMRKYVLGRRMGAASQIAVSDYNATLGGQSTSVPDWK